MSCNWFVCPWLSFIIRLHVCYDHLYSTHSPVICLIKTSVAKKVIHTHKKTHPPPEPTIISWSLHRRMKSFSPVHGKHCGRGLIRNSMVSPVPKNWADLECLSWSSVAMNAPNTCQGSTKAVSMHGKETIFYFHHTSPCVVRTNSRVLVNSSHLR